MNELKTGEHDLLSILKPDTPWGALIYFALFVLLAMGLSRLLRRAVHASMIRKGHIDRTTISFLQQFGTAAIWVIMLILYAHLIPVLRSLGTALLAGASVASVVIGLAAQSTLGNLVAGISITLYKPFRLGDVLEVTAPTGAETGVVEQISLGYTTLRAPAGHLVVLPNALVSSSAILNLSQTFTPWPLTITLRLGRDTDVEAARKLALDVASDAWGESLAGHSPGSAAVASGVPEPATRAASAARPPSCFLTKVEASAITLELRLQAQDARTRDALRSALIEQLAGRFAAAHLGGGGSDLPSFS